MNSNAEKLPLSVLIISKNAEAYLGQVLSAVQDLAAEIIVVDSGSTDQTINIAEAFGARVYTTEHWPGFGPQKNYALSLASKDWVLALDTDEVLSDELCNNIRAAVLANKPIAYQLERISYFCGAFMQHSGWRPDWVLRLFPRQAARFSDNLVHEKVMLIEDFPIHKLKGIAWHYSYLDFESVLNKINVYSSAGAQACAKKGKPVSFTQALLRAFWAFMRTYFLKAGFLDGKYGLMLAIANAEVVYYKYVKYLFLSEKKSK